MTAKVYFAGTDKVAYDPEQHGAPALTLEQAEAIADEFNAGPADEQASGTWQTRFVARGT